MATSVSTLIVGGGYAGLAASYHLSQAGVEHLILERGRVGETWRSQRWDSFALNTNIRISVCPGQTYRSADPEGFALSRELIGEFERFVADHRLPLMTDTEVIALESGSGGNRFRLNVTRDGASEVFESRDVIVASGFQNSPQIPSISGALPQDLLQIHAAQYRNQGLLPPGSVLVVGSAQ